MSQIRQELIQEWQLNQQQVEHYERFTLLIKLCAFLVTILSLLFGAQWLAVLVVCMLWLQDGIWKTFQSRLEERILQLEDALYYNDGSARPFQLHTQWQAQRPGTVALIISYLRCATRPTVAYPYPLLMLLLLVSLQIF